MTERKKQKKKKEECETKDEKPSKEQYAVAKYLKNNLPAKKTTLFGHKVEYFIASKAINALLDSPWASGVKKTPVVFTDRESVEAYLDLMLQMKFFHRAKKFVQKDYKKIKKKDDDTADEKKSGKEDEKKLNNDDDKKSNKEDDKENDADKKKKRKIKLDMHLDQIFVDGNDAYVWIYDPIPMKSWVIGALIVFGSIALCLFPLWPATIRLGVYYLSLAAAGFVIVLIGLAIVRLIIFSLLWACTMGKHHFWLLPNLTEDVGFFESFWPLYFYEYKGEDAKKSSDKEESLKLDDIKEADKSAQKEASADSDSKDSVSDQNSEEDRTDNGFEVVDQQELTSNKKDS